MTKRESALASAFVSGMALAIHALDAGPGSIGAVVALLEQIADGDLTPIKTAGERVLAGETWAEGEIGLEIMAHRDMARNVSRYMWARYPHLMR